jgi:medium-chain acyl-[acyl-carrier-protein] hydrolase
MTTNPKSYMKNGGSWLLVPKPNPKARLRLFCFPFAGGNAQIYRSFGTRLASDIEVCAVEIPGRGRRMCEEAYVQLSPLVADTSAALLPYMDKPFAFFGHSMGALISFELARLLRNEARQRPVHLFVSARRAPHIPDLDPPTYNLPDEEFITEIRRLNGTPKEVLENDELSRLLLPILRADFSVCQTYDYQIQPPLECGITAYGGTEDVDVTKEHIDAWREHTKGSFAAHMLQGNHFFLQSSQEVLLELLGKDLDRLLSSIMFK